jgi:putative phosphoribosyl transferase
MIPGRKSEKNYEQREVVMDVNGAKLAGCLTLPQDARGVVLFAHGSGSSRRSPRNLYVAEILQSRGIATLLFDLLTRTEESIDEMTGEFRFDIPLLAKRLAGATGWAMRAEETHGLKIAYFGASTGASAALVAAAELPEVVTAIVSRGGRPDLAGNALGKVRAPTLLIVGGEDKPVITMNQKALAQLDCNEKKLVIVPGATHLFEEPGTLEKVAQLAAEWLARHFLRLEKSRAQAAGKL